MRTMMRTVRQDNRSLITKKRWKFLGVKQSIFADLTITSSLMVWWEKELSYQHILKGMHNEDRWWWMVWKSFPVWHFVQVCTCVVLFCGVFQFPFLLVFCLSVCVCFVLCSSILVVSSKRFIMYMVIVIKTLFHWTLKYESFPRIFVKIFACLVNLSFSV